MQKTKWLLATIMVSLSLLLSVTLLKSAMPTKSQSSKEILKAVADRLIVSRNGQMQIFSSVMRSIPFLTPLQNGTIFKSKDPSVQVADNPVFNSLAKNLRENFLRGTMEGTDADISSKAIPIKNLSLRLLEDNSTSEALPTTVIVSEGDAPPPVDGQVLVIEELDTSSIDEAKLSVPEQRKIFKSRIIGRFWTGGSTIVDPDSICTIGLIHRRLDNGKNSRHSHRRRQRLSSQSAARIRHTTTN